MMRTTLLASTLLVLAACGGRNADTDAQAAADKAAAEQPAAKRQKTVFDDQLKALDKAKGVEQQLMDEKEKHDREIEKQESGD